MLEDQKPWFPFYAVGTRPFIDPLPYQTLGEMASNVAKNFKDEIAFTTILPNGMSGQLTYAQVDTLSDGFAVYLRDVLKLKQGDRVALQCPNSLPCPVAIFGIFKAGCVLINVNPLYTADEMVHQWSDAKPSAIVICNLFNERLEQAIARCPIPHIVVTHIADYFPPLKKMLVGFVQKYIHKTIAKLSLSHASFSSAVQAGLHYKAKHNVDVASYYKSLTHHDIACLQYTGGTTGSPKGAMLTHANLLANQFQFKEMAGIQVKKGMETVLTVLPLYHIFAFTVNLLGFYLVGAHNVLVPNPKPLTNLKPVFKNQKITWMTGVNTLFNGLMNESWFKDSPPLHLKASVAGGMALHQSVAERWNEMVGSPVLEGYGLTETSPVVTFNPFGRVKAGSIGIPLPSTDMICVDEAGHPVSKGQTGELCVKGPQVMKGYWKQEKATADMFTPDGWLKTGDIATIDDEGYAWIVDRKKDMILVSGFNVYPNEIEECLARHPGVLEVAVIGVPDGAAGEAVKAFIVPKNESANDSALRKHCRTHLTGYKIPKYFAFRTTLPKSPIGKILRKDLRQDVSQTDEPAKGQSLYHDFYITSLDGLKLYARDYQPARTTDALPVICLPGLTRNSHDFDELATLLSQDDQHPRRVLSLDYRGRGRSDYDKNPSHYNVQTETMDVLQVLTKAKVQKAVFVGTSRGGLITMGIAFAQASLIAGVVLNDIGPVIELEGLEEIRRYVGRLPDPETFEQAATNLENLFKQEFPVLLHDDWLSMAKGLWREDVTPGVAKLVLNYDKALMQALDGLDSSKGLPDIWPFFDRLKPYPLLVIRGENSKLLSKDTLEQMSTRHASMAIVYVAGQGHAPVLKGDLNFKIQAFIRKI